MQNTTARSTCESEFVAMSHCAMELVYLARLASSLKFCNTETDMTVNQGPANEESAYKVWQSYVKNAKAQGGENLPSMLWSDSTAALSNANSPFGWTTGKLRHIKTAFNFFKDYVMPNDLGVKINLQAAAQVHIKTGHVRGEDNCGDILTKGFGSNKTRSNQKTDHFQRHAHFVLGMRNYVA